MASLAGGPLWSGDTPKHRARLHRIAAMPTTGLPIPERNRREREALHAAEAEALAIRKGNAADRKQAERERLDALHAEKEAERLAAEAIPCRPENHPDTRLGASFAPRLFDTEGDSTA